MATGRKYLDIDELYRSKLEDFPVEPGEAVKADLMRRVSAKEFIRFNPTRFNVYYLAAAVVSVSVALVIAFGNPFAEIKPDGNVIIEGAVPEMVPSVGDISLADTSKIAETPEIEITSTESMKSSGSEIIGRGVSEKENQVTQGSRTAGTSMAGRQIAREITIAGSGDRLLSEGSPLSSFTISGLSGCAPLTVRLQSTSKNYETLIWTGSDGRNSSDDNIEWVLSQPGLFTIILKVTGNDGREHTSSASVTVHALPVARFDISQANKELSDREIMIYNYSEGALTSHWDFGDGETSTMREPIHLYGSSGRYRVLLTVTNEFGCTDTVSKYYMTSAEDYRLEFPNAFIPNKNGPTGGYYSLRTDEAANVFHPVYEGIADYHLVIYSRMGMVLFESRSLSIGWDGYYKGQLCEPGVYVWRARGRYSSGETYHKSGDITLLKF